LVYTVAFREDKIAGTLEANKRADFVVLSRDPRYIDPEKILDIDIIHKIIGGELVFNRLRGLNSPWLATK